MQDNGLGKALALAAQLGFSVALPMVVFIGGGVWLDARLGTRPWLLFLGVILGVLSAAAAFYQIAVAQPTRRRDAGAPRAEYKVERRTGDVGTPRADKKRHNGR
ncbi:MAG: AtpZ/AtpI family protein [Chloroflexi bacterium]|nr:AtpZ/AtpI family protein [Chloroflexota bacterium]